MRGILSACAIFCGFFTLPEAEAAVMINIDDVDGPASRQQSAARGRRSGTRKGDRP